MQTHPKELVPILEKEIPLEVNLHPTKYTHVLYVVFMAKEVFNF